ncbi:MAG TPA: GAF domain-containing protein, partial [Burkholderiaceae bacterium]|nr:GAF domain-containing protein [Burkholderiaceae bacterium]
MLQAVAERAARLCNATDAVIRRADADGLRLVAHHGPVPVTSIVHPCTSGSVGGTAVIERRTVQVEDIVEACSSGAYPEAPALQQAGGYRTILAVPLLRNDVALGVIVIRRMEVRLFDERHVRLLEVFADQAAIAIEHVRLFNETQEALGQQTAIAGVLKVINQSTFDLPRVLGTLIEHATRLCDASHGFVFRPDGPVYRLAAANGASPEFEAHIRRIAVQPARGYLIGRVVLERRCVQIADALADPDYQQAESQRLGGYRTMLGVPMLSGSDVVGVIVVWRQEVRAFTDKQIELLTTFADQAAIAVENVRLFNETKEALERQTATAEILKVIAGSPSDVQPVFDAIVKSAKALVNGLSTTLTLVADGKLHLRAFTSTSGAGDQVVQQFFPIPVQGTPMGRAVLTRRPVAIVDFESGKDIQPAERALARARGFSSAVFVPLMQSGEVIGTLNVTRGNPGSFTDQQLGLLKTFADQAVIAIQNARLFNETKAALERQTATAEVLKVISESPTDVQPVFDAICDRAMALCSASVGAVTRFDGEWVHLVAYRGTSPQAEASMRAAFPRKPDLGSITSRAVLMRAAVQIPDVFADPDYAL